MSRIGVNDGHTITGPGSGAVGRINESKHTRLVGDVVRRELRAKGDTVYNCTVDYARTTSDSLALVVQQANRQDLDWFIAIHFNAGGGRGVEAYTYEGRQYQDAIDVCKNIANLGFKNRGVKAGTGLYVVRNSKAKSILIEVCFVDTDDANKYLEVGHEAIGKAIANAISYHTTPSVPNPPPTSTVKKSDWIRRLQHECNRQGFSKQKVDGLAGPATLAGCPTLRKGDRGNITRLLQERLTGFGFGTNGVDGVFGAGTQSAVIRYQSAHKLGADGVVGQKTWSKLLNM